MKLNIVDFCEFAEEHGKGNIQIPIEVMDVFQAYLKYKQSTQKYDCDNCEYYPCSHAVEKEENKVLYGQCGDHSERLVP